jgi:hypothetical protein
VQISVRLAACGALIFALACGIWPIQVPRLGSATTVRGVGGTLVVMLWSVSGDYVVVAAESRRTDLQGVPVNNTACKILGLGSTTLFFMTGKDALQIYKNHRTLGKWDAEDLARTIYRKSSNHYAGYLSDDWQQQTLDRLRAWQKLGAPISQMAYAGTGIIAEGGFVGPGSDSPLTFRTFGIYYSMADDAIFTKPPPYRLQPGGAFFWGAGQGQAKTYLSSHTLSAGHDPAFDEDLAKRMVQFAIDNSTGQDHELLGGDIDVALLRSGQKIQWIARKKDCYALDQN